MSVKLHAYRFDTHVHTGETSLCGRIKGSEVVRLYSHAGYDGVVITDHYGASYFRRYPKLSWEEKIDKFLSGYRGALEEGRRLGFNVLLGMEIKFTESPNEYLVYGIDEAFLKNHPELYKLGLKKFRELVKSNGEAEKILIFQAHPFRPGLHPADPSLIDGVEVFNGNPRQDSHNELAYLYAKEHRLKMISGSDFHRAADLGRGGIILPEEIDSSADLVELLNENRIIKLIFSPKAPFSMLRFFSSLLHLVRRR